MNTKITVSGNKITVERDNQILSERSTTTYFVDRMSGPGYVRIKDDAGRYPQACAALGSTGSTLMATADTLPSVIRRELRRLVAIERRILGS